MNAAEPTMKEGPSSPGFFPRVEHVSMMVRRISGAEQPRAISVRFATVGFQMLTFVLTRSPVYLSCLKITLFAEVITPIALKNDY